MLLDKRICRALCRSIARSMNISAGIFDPEGILIHHTDCATSEETARLRNQLTLLIHTEISAPDVLRFPLLHADGSAVGTVIMPDAGSHPEYVTWTQTLFALCAANEALTEQAHAESSDKSSFLYEILASRLTDDETIVSRAAKLKYRSHVPRCAIIFSFLAQAENGEGTNDEQFRAQFSRVLRETPGFNAEDFGDLLTRQQFVLFKTVPAGNIESRKNFLSNFVHDVLEENPLLDGLCVHVGIGTVYQDLPRMRDSYLEALFVVKNLSVLCTEGTMGFAEDYTFDYLMSLLSEDYQDHLLGPYADRLRQISYLPETLKALCATNNNLLQCAKHLSIHRNTMLQRYTKLTETVGLDPVHRSSDRLIARQCAVYLNRKKVLHAGIIIQSSSDLHLGFHHFGTLLEEKSHSSIALEVTNVGISGNNKSLLELLLCGTMDFIVIDIDPLISYSCDELAVCNLPHVFESYEDAYALLSGPIGQRLLKSGSANGAICLGFWSMGWRYLSSRSAPVRTPEDMRGQRIRTMNKKVVQDYFTSLDAVAIPISYDNILPALTEKIVDMQENPFVNFRDMRLYEQQRWILKENSIFSTNMLITSELLWKKLTHEQRRIVLEAARESTAWQWQHAKQHNAECEAQLVEKHGVHLYTPTQAEQAQWNQQALRFRQIFPHQQILSEIAAIREEARHGSPSQADF